MNILVLDDEKEIADLVEVYLKNENYNVFKFYDSKEAIKCIENQKLDFAILDEPTSNLDKHTEEIVVDFILKHFKDKTLIIATHNEKINEICNKFYHFDNHKLLLKDNA